MKKEKPVVYDEMLRIEACHFTDIDQPFPNHFHAHYVIGLIESGARRMTCKNREYWVGKGSMLLFNPGDSHACVQCDGGTLDYRSFHISKEIMLDLSEDITGKRALPGFSQNVIHDDEAACYLRQLHEMVMRGSDEFEKEEYLLLLLSLLIQAYGQPFEDCGLVCRAEVANACAFLERHYTERVSLAQLCQYVGMSKSALLRAFTKEKGVTPYRYLEAIRINAAKALLEQGVSPLETAMRTGFSDQSHFTNYFSRFIGVSPGTYREIFLEKRTESK